ncbi:alanine--tRNA ligase [Candidatus Synchoanobacter obligatus]|uniref:Alanine--tRNA ligase n=1 Tax=Candidatus Synchoanobacter obligatus TaxID=2919597 RepID=A0ABT1L396_9GAMM|nr:alanine--tRNA ligase [Candidatus Synchoanobacter obligatus]MCP8351700.1 alanine--tRNA ligase [Candidatus Synchoanobacter obligatus]
MNSNQIRETFIKYFASKGYQPVDSASLVPAGDQTLLFTNAGMVPFKDYFLGVRQPESLKVVSSQKCIRAGGKHNDLEQVGLTARHHTFFEMLGNFVFKGANKSVAIQEAWELMTEHYNIPKDKLWVTVYHDDHEARKIWESVIGIPSDRVISCGEKDNFWSMGDVGPCGPCTEIFYDHGDSVAGGPPGSPDEDGDRYTEIWNLVFMQYEMLPDGRKVELESMGLDTGMGLERLCAVLQSVYNNYDSDLFTEIIGQLSQQSMTIDTVSSRVIADHIRATVFLILDQVYPSNEGRGYVLRRIIRRAMGFAYRQGVTKPFFHQLVDSVAKVMGAAYPGIHEHQDVIVQVIKDEELRFHSTIEQGMKILEKNISQKIDIDGKTAFMMYDTYGFPLDIAKDLAKKYQLKLDEEGYHAEMLRQKDRSRASHNFSVQTPDIKLPYTTEFTGHLHASDASMIVHLLKDNAEIHTLQEGDTGVVVVEKTPFYPEGGGQVGDCGNIQTQSGAFKVLDTQKIGQTILHFGHVEQGSFNVGEQVSLEVDTRRQDTMLNHSATHLIHEALREVLGKHVVQKGSLVNHERLRFDFTHNQPMTLGDIQSVERIVNEQIRLNHAQVCEWVSLADAKKMDIMALFDEKYEDPVRVVRFGAFSAELCGGTHVKATGEIGLLMIVSETGIASGVRRLEALTGACAFKEVQSQKAAEIAMAQSLKCDVVAISHKVDQLLQENKQLRKKVEASEKEYFKSQVSQWIQAAVDIDGEEKLIAQVVSGASGKTLRMLHDLIKSSVNHAVIVLQAPSDQGCTLLVGGVGVKYPANKIFKALSERYSGKGGGNPKMAQGVLEATSIHADELLKILQGL